MSLASYLLSKAQAAAKGGSKQKISQPKLDEGLDAIFRAAPVPKPAVRPTRGADAAEPVEKGDALDSLKDGSTRKRKRAKPSDAGHISEEASASAHHPEPAGSKEKKKGRGKDPKLKRRKVDDPRSDEEDARLEDSYGSRTASSSKAGVLDTEVEARSEGESDDEEVDPAQLVHESVANAGKQTSKGSRSRKSHYVPESETSEQRDRRTIFVGNVPADVAKSRPLQKRLKRHILTFVPSAKIESVRFRSVAFQKPTTELPKEDDDSTSKQKSSATEKKGRQHDADRAASWRLQTKDKEAIEDEKAAKKYLNPKEKKKVAFIKGELHPNVDSIVAYIVFAHPKPVQEASDAPTSQQHKIMNPFEAAQQAVLNGDGTVFMEHTLRVDHARPSEASKVAGDIAMGDPKLSVFVGNLDFATKEEDLRVFFEALLSTERGPPPAPGPDTIENIPAKRISWVTKVRVVRDRDTQMGKGFAYVQFLDRECVDEVLALEPERLKFAKRKLRVQRCKAPGSGKTGDGRQTRPDRQAKPTEPSLKRSVSKTRLSGTPIVVPKGDPSLGEKLSHLPKEERKQAKAADEARVQRRLAKKLAKNAMVKSTTGKDKERIRKRPSTKTNAGGAAKEVKKRSRIRSEKSLQKRNVKK
ncbi:hypothetical protein PUNSTDRAFT_131036 [Punctularia strigosozonata HHB-11173 SS5]|uniref:uncharacterized protein n=1 Tax=Punctularia strigosozonata (strain HHB-11173) TaxID=741275 RepID=UPI00044174A8|nr:uncharacterized protein PUNSTDRAFT_131036 [Punctularia strigosozonata HHB-11173 SS5]EIN12798.1 hypothetical protein PUNSTDRAFT_131036 [Punctularia strigosozonata HHB-11173 SS5]